MAFGAGMGGVSQGPTPWWQLPEYRGSLENLKSSAPPGYIYDPVKMGYTQTPQAAGAAVNEFTQAANPALAGLFASIGGAASGAGGGTVGGGGGIGTSGTTGTSGGPSGSSSFGGVTPGGTIAAPTLPDSTAATNAAFATAKDKAGKISRASLDSLRGELGATGNLGGGAEVQGVRDIISSGAGLEGQAARDEAMKQSEIAADFAKTGYAGAITQRGQDVSAQEAQARLAQERELQASRLAFEQQQLKSQQQLQMLQLALSGLKGGSTGYNPTVY